MHCCGLYGAAACQARSRTTALLAIPNAGGLDNAAGFSPKIRNFVWRLTNGASQPQILETQVQ